MNLVTLETAHLSEGLQKYIITCNVVENEGFQKTEGGFKTSSLSKDWEFFCCTYLICFQAPGDGLSPSFPLQYL